MHMHNRRSFGIIRGVNHPSPDWREVANGKTARGTRWACVAVNGGGKPNCANIALYALCAAFCAVLDGRVALCRDLGRDEARPSREGHARPLAALRVRFAQATRRLRRGRILSRPTRPASNQGTKRTDGTQGKIPLAPLPSFAVAAVPFVPLSLTST